MTIFMVLLMMAVMMTMVVVVMMTMMAIKPLGPSRVPESVVFSFFVRRVLVGSFRGGVLRRNFLE